MMLREMLKFLPKPHIYHEDLPVKKKVTGFLILFLVCVFIVYSLNILLQLLVPAPENGVEEMSFPKLLLYALLLAPLFEESVFRLSLVYSKINLSVSLSLALTAIITNLMDIRLLTIWGVIIFAVLFIGFIAFFSKTESISQRLNNFWNGHFTLIFYGFALIFGLFHSINYEFHSFSAYVLAVVFSIPQFIGALFMGFVRIRLGFVWAVLMHILLNGIPFGLSFVFSVI